MEIKLKYMTVHLSVMPEGFEVGCWISAVEFWQSEKAHFPYNYTYMGEHCTWIIHANMELTSKVVTMAGEQADRMCLETEARNNRRKIANRS